MTVCRQWRHIALPLFSRTAVLVYQDNIFSRAPMQWRTNVEIIAKSNNLSRIRQVIVKVNWQNHTLQMLNTLFDHLSIEQGPWTNVRVLKVVSDKDDGSLLYTHPIDRDEQQPEPADDTIEQQPEPTNAAIEQQNVFQIASAAAKIAAHLPNVHRLYFLGNDAESCCSEFVQHLSAVYGTQLGAFTGNTSALKRVPTQLTQLTKLELGLNGGLDVDKLPSICSETLRHLKLTEVLGNDIWHCFANAGNDMEIDGVLFHNLEKLFVSYKDVPLSEEQGNMFYSSSDQNSRGLRLYFPKLVCLDVEKCPSSSFLLNAEASSALKSFRITDCTGQLELTKHLSKYKDPVDSVVVSTCAPAGDASAFYSATSQLFGGKSCAIFTSLTLCSSPEMLDFNRINWIQLNKLSIFTRVPAVVLIDLISRLPSLNDLALSAVTMEGWDHQKESEVDNENCEPISTTITKVYYNDIFMSGDSSTPEFLKYLLLAIPNIAEFAFSNEYFHEMLKFVQALGHKSHPHLFQIRYDILC
ncbi:hypothetical protein IWW40_002876 [Coemansia sp. RSA 1250]|nr:hypothetical protein IWW40_002876 [Coemansia sp. RSA 1250]